MIRSDRDAGNALKFELYKDVMRLLEKHNYPGAWSGGWTLIRGLGKKLLKNDYADDADCADAILSHYHRLPHTGLQKKRRK